MPNFYPYESQMVEAEYLGFDVYEIKFESILKGLYVNGVIAIEARMSWVEKNCIIAEEIGHALTSCGDITDQSSYVNRKQEHRARAYAYNKLIPLSKLIEAYKYGCANRYEASEYLNVTEQFFLDSIRYYYDYYGCNVAYRNYIINFSPNNIYISEKEEIKYMRHYK